MSTQTATPIKPIPQGQSSEGIEIKKNLYVLYYRAGNNPHAMQKHFFQTGDMRQVVDRAKKHCEIMGYRFVRVEPFLFDLSADENKHTGGSQDDANG